MMIFPTRVIGSSMFCPDCGKLLVEVDEDGNFTMAENATVQLQGMLDSDELPILQGAQCLGCPATAKRRKRAERISAWWVAAASVVERLTPAGRVARMFLAWIGFITCLIALTDWIAR